MDLNMLVTDFYVLTTMSHVGSRFDDLFSHSYCELPFLLIVVWQKVLSVGKPSRTNTHIQLAAPLQTSSIFLPFVLPST